MLTLASLMISMLFCHAVCYDALTLSIHLSSSELPAYWRRLRPLMLCTRYSSGKEAAYQKADICDAREQASVAGGRET